MPDLNLRWESYDEEQSDGSEGDIVVGYYGSSDFRIIAQAVDKDMGEMIVRDVLAHDTLTSRCDRLAVDLAEKTAANERLVEACRAVCEHPGSGDPRYINSLTMNKIIAALKAAGENE